MSYEDDDDNRGVDGGAGDTGDGLIGVISILLLLLMLLLKRGKTQASVCRMIKTKRSRRKAAGPFLDGGIFRSLKIIFHALEYDCKEGEKKG